MIRSSHLKDSDFADLMLGISPSPAKLGHLASCPRCAKQALQADLLSRELKQATDFDPAWGLEQKTLQALGFNQPAAGFWARFGAWSFKPVLAAASGALALAVLFLVWPAFHSSPVAGNTAPASSNPPLKIAAAPQAGLPNSARKIPAPVPAPAGTIAPSVLAALPEAGAKEIPSPKAPSFRPGAGIQKDSVLASPVLAARLVAPPAPASAPRAAAARGPREGPTATPQPWKYGLSARNNVFKPGRGESTVARLVLEKTSRVEISVYRSNGRFLKTLFSGDQAAGSAEYAWAGNDASGGPAPSGLYWIVVRTSDKIEKLKTVIVR